MDPMNVLVVEKGADWRNWDATSHLVGHAMLVLVQQVDETTAAFRARIQQRLSRLSQGLGALVLLRGRRGSGLTAEGLVRGLAQSAPTDVRTFTRYFGPELGTAATMSTLATSTAA
jgi:predicted GNAT family N-acyltransferase